MSKVLHNERMNKVVEYIENNLDLETDVSHLSSIAFYSEFHFHRLFRLYVGESVLSYKKRLLLERSIKQLSYTDDNITEIAFKSGYDNQSSFNKAFKKQFSYTPSQVRKQMVSINISNIHVNIIEGKKMKPEIENIEDIPVICARGKGEYREASAEAWGKIMKFTYSNKLMNKSVKLIGISHDDPNITEDSHIRYDACLNITPDISNEENIQTRTISGGKYAIFTHKGAYDQLNNTYGYIFNDWLPENGNSLRDEPCFEIYLNRDPRRTKPENLKTQIYVAIN